MFDPQKYDYFLDLTKEVAVRKCGTRIREIFFSSIRCETRDGKVGDLREPNGISTNSGMSPPWEVVNERSFVLSLLSLSLSLLKKRKICSSREIDGNQDEIRTCCSTRFLNSFHENPTETN